LDSAASARLVALAVMFFGGALRGQEAGTVGGVRGIVIDAEGGVPVPGARVVLSTTGQAAATDSAGRFVFDNVRPGIHEIICSKGGFERGGVRDVAVVAGSFREVEVRLNPQVIEMEELVVTDEVVGRETEQQLLLQRSESSALFEAIGKEAFSRQGLSTAAAALKKVTGTSVQDDRYVVIRGLSDRYVTTLLNGAPIPSSDPEKRAVNVDIFPTEVIDNIRVTKAYQPNLPGDSSGGNVDIGTLSLPDKFVFKLGGGIKYNSRATFNDKFLTYKGGGVPGFGFDHDRSLPDEADLALTGPPGSLAPDSATADKWDRATRAFEPVLGASEEAPPLSHNYSGLLGDTVDFLGRPLGMLFGASYEREYNFFDDGFAGRWAINDLDGGRTLRPRNAVGDIPNLSDVARGTEKLLMSGLFNLAFKPSDDNSIGLTLLFTQSAKDTTQIKITPPAEDLRGRLDDTIYDLDHRYEEQVLVYSERSLYSVQLHGDHSFDGLNETEIRWRASRNHSRQYEPDGRRFRSVIDASGAYTPGTSGQSSDPSILRQWLDYRDDSYHFSMDVSIPFTSEGTSGPRLDLGIYYDTTTRDFINDVYAYFPGLGANRAGTTRYQPTGDESWAEVFYDLPETIGRVHPGEVSLPPNLLNRAMYWYIYNYDDPFAEYDADQKITAAYAMVTAKFGPAVEVIAGARIEATDIEAISRAPDDRFGPGSFFPSRAGEIKQTDVLPAALVNVDVAAKMKVRLAASQTVARPTFRELAPAFERDLIEGTLFRGNPDLEMSAIDNFDIRWEWFPKQGDVVSAGLFYKRIRNPIEFSGDPTSDFYENSPEARVYGVEIEARKRFDDLARVLGGWDWLKHVEVGLNAAYIESIVEKQERILEEARNAGLIPPAPTRTLQGQPTYTANASIAYDDEASGTFAGLFFGIAGPFLYRASASAFAVDVYEQPAPQLDLTLSQRLSDHWKVTLRAKNLLDSERRRTIPYGGTEYIYSSNYEGRDFSLGLGFTW